MNWKTIRDEFPVCDKWVYLNPAGGSPLSKSAYLAATQYYEEMLALGDSKYDEWMERTSQVRQKIAHYIGAESHEMAFTTNTSHGMNLIAQILKNKGDVLTMADEFPSSTIPWLNQGINVQTVSSQNGIYPLNHIEKSITTDTKILLSSYVQYNTGFRQDLKALGEFCKTHNLIFVVNATQALPVFPIDVKQMNIDFLVFTGLKWATAGYGIGGLYIANHWLKPGNLPFAGWQSVEEPEQMNNMSMNIRPDAATLESGCPHFPNIFALGGALDLFIRIGNQEAANRVLDLNNMLNHKLHEIGLHISSSQDESHRSGITIVKTKNANRIVQMLAKKNILVSARGQGIRISVNIFNNEEDIQLLIQEILQIKHEFED